MPWLDRHGEAKLFAILAAPIARALVVRVAPNVARCRLCTHLVSASADEAGSHLEREHSIAVGATVIAALFALLLLSQAPAAVRGGTGRGRG